MTLIELIKQIDLPFAYDHFAEGESPTPPFLLYLLPRSHHFKADGGVYLKVNVVHLELYTDKKAIDVEKRVEDSLDSYSIVYDKSEVWIESEKLYEVLYTFEMEENKLWEIKSNII